MTWSNQVKWFWGRSPRSLGFRVWVIRGLSIFCLAVLGMVSVAQISTSQPALSARQEIRGVWLTNVDSAVLFNRRVLQNAVTDLQRMGFNTLYPTVWNWGYTLYPSRVARDVIGVDRDPRPEARGLRGRDMLAEMVKEGHKHKLAVLPWFEFGFMAPADSELAARRPDWLTQRQDGTTVWMEGIWPRVWLNPFHPEVQRFIQALVIEIVSRYDVDGIQFDDHFGLPNEFGYDDYTLSLYQQENPGRPLPAPQDPEWVRWRADKITDFMQQLFEAVKARKKKVLVALSPNPFDFAYNAHLQDWFTWEREGLIEELIVQVYRSDRPRFIQELDHPTLLDAKQHVPTGIGILTGLKGRPVPFRQIQDQVQMVRDRGYSGVSFFFYETLWNLVNEPKNQRRAGFRSLFARRVTRPNLEEGWRPSLF
uniref:Glycoside hydrolase family 10 protein n=1 Tax=Oscillatoriales cyanobacterium SpSt-418 TaxID=2282169 RepID=A0A7C3KJA6_9CYAN